MLARKGRVHAALAGLVLAIAAGAAHANPPARDWSEPPDFEALRAEYTARADFDTLCAAARPLTEAFADMQAERWSDLLAVTGPWTERCPVDLEAHSLRAVALGQSGRLDEADAQNMWARGLFEMVLASGDGKTPATAYQVISEFEEYAMLRMFRYAPKRQATEPNGVDALTVLIEGEEQTLYFEAKRGRARFAAGATAPSARN